MRSLPSSKEASLPVTVRIQEWVDESQRQAIHFPEAMARVAIFDFFCNVCHPTGAGIGPGLFGNEFNRRFGTDPALIDLLRKGAGAMPGYTTERTDVQQMAEVIACIRSLKQP